MHFELISDGKIRLAFNRNTPEEAGQFVKDNIAGNGTWSSLKDIDPNECKLRVARIAYDYYNLEGELI